MIRLAFAALLVLAVGPARADAGAAIAAYEKGDFRRAFTEFADMAREGNPAAQNNLAVMYANGQGVERDLAAAAGWYAKAAEQGLPTAQYNLGALYEAGTGVERDPYAAAVWYQLAAMQGDAHAQLSLGRLYAAGEGVERDRVAAYYWLALAASRTSDVRLREEALAERARVDTGLSEGERAQAEAMLSTWRSAR